jgi:hypothetical protein
MPCGMCHNLGPSLIIIMEDGDQYFEKNNFMSNFFHNTMYQIVIDGWQLMKSTWHHECNYNGVA